MTHRGQKLEDIWARGKNLVVAVDGSKYGDAAIDWAINNMYGPNDTLHLIFCYEPLQEVVDLEGGILYTMSEEDRARVRAGAEDVLTQSVKRVLGEEPAVKFKTHLMVGDPRDNIQKLADEINADAVIVGNRGRGVLARAFLGSVSSHLSHNLKQPLVIVRAD